MIEYRSQTAVYQPSSKTNVAIVTICLLLGGLAVFVFGSPYYRVFAANWNQTYNVALTAFFLVLALVLWHSHKLAWFRTAVIFGVSQSNGTYEFPGGGQAGAGLRCRRF